MLTPPVGTGQPEPCDELRAGRVEGSLTADAAGATLGTNASDEAVIL
jgi:hypothetical protein